MTFSAAIPFDWDDKLLVGQGQMDEEHKEFMVLIDGLRRAADDVLAESLDVVVHHATHHFAQEDQWMTQLGFPARQCHMDEHSAVLRSASAIQQRMRAGDLAAARVFAQELSAWFPAHVQHLDSALAAWICKSTWNAKPLVFHRRDRMNAVAVPT